MIYMEATNTEQINRLNIESFAYGIAAEFNLGVSYAPCGMALHTEAGSNMGIVVTEGHSVSLHFTVKGGNGRRIRECNTVEEARKYIAFFGETIV